MSIKGWSTQEKDDRLVPQYATVEPVRELQNALSVLSHEFVREVGTDSVEANSTTILINATGHAAKVGDVIRITSGTLSGQEVKVYSVATNSITLAEELASAPALGVTFQILRHKYPVVEATGEIKVTGSFTEVATAADGGSLPAVVKVIGGYDGSAVQVLQTDKFGQLQVDVNNTATDVFQTAIGGTRYNQIEVKFVSSPGSSYVTDTTSGGASISYANGHGIYTSGTATSAQARSVSVQSVTYRPGAEVYSMFTAAFTTPTSANSYQRIGIYDANNGFFIGYEGTSFGITKRVATVDTSVAKASFNVDTLTGAAGSRFTRDGVPEAINLAYSNLFRIRYAWLGSGPVLFDVMSPDGEWVLFHILRQPNSQLNPTIANPDLPMTIDVKKTSADATSLVMATACWGAGTTSELVKITDTLSDLSLAALSRSVITGVTTGGGGGYVNVKVNPSGALVTEASISSIADVDGQKTMALSFPVVIASDQSAVPASQSGTWNITNVSGTISLPTGAATETTLASVKTSVELIDDAVGTDGSAVSTGMIRVGGTDGTNNQTISVNSSGHVNIADGGNSITVDVGTALPSGTNNIGDVDVLSVVPGTGPTDLGKAIDSAVGATDTGVAALVVRDDALSAITPADNDYTVKRVSNFGRLWIEHGGRTAQNRARIDYSSSSVTTSAYTQLLASTSAIIQEVEIFDSSGQTLVLATGGAGAEADQVYIFPGGNGRIPLYIAASTRVAIKAVSATANSGEISVNFYGG